MASEVTLVFSKTLASIQGGTLDAITFDASISEQHDAEVTTTDHPIESGADITDHIQPRPRTLQLEGIISNTPIPAIGHVGAVIGNRAGSAFDRLLKLRLGTLVTVVTSIERLENMMIVKLSVPRDAQSGNSLRFQVQLKEIRLVSSSVVKIIEPKHVNKKNLGEVKTSKTDTPKDNRTLAAKADDATGKLVSGGGLKALIQLAIP